MRVAEQALSPAAGMRLLGHPTASGERRRSAVDLRCRERVRHLVLADVVMPNVGDRGFAEPAGDTPVRQRRPVEQTYSNLVTPL